MKVRLKFRNKFYPATFESSVTLSDVLSAASSAFKIDMSNVQLSLNAKDYFGMEECQRTLTDLGIVSGDILYVNSLEDLDDIKKSMELELSSKISRLMENYTVPQHTLASLVSIAVLLFASEKHLHAVDPVSEELTRFKEIVRLKLTYRVEHTIHLIFTIYSTGNLINIACGAQGLEIRRQLILPIRDHLVASAITTNSSHAFRNLQTLGIRVKDELIEPILVTIHTELGLHQRLLLYTLPPELLIRILLFLPLSALGKLMLTNSFMRRQITSCNPVWRMHLNRLNAKKQPLLDAALTRQQRQRQQQLREQSEPQQFATETCNVAEGPPVSGVETSPPAPGEAQSEVTDANESPSDPEVDDTTTSPFYERFVARYRSLLIQRRCRGLSPSFV